MLDNLLITFQQRAQYCKDYFQCRMDYIVTKTKFNQPMINLPQTNAELIKDIVRLKKERKDKIDFSNTQNKNLNAFGLRCGKYNGIFVVDFDDIDAYNKLNEEIKKRNGD